MRCVRPARSLHLHPHGSGHPCGPAGFTLIELLVVISIVAVLAGMLLPAVAALKEMAKSTRCAASQRQVGMAVALYCEDWDGNLPSLRRDAPAPDGVTYWCGLIAPTLGFQADGSDGTFTKEWKLRLVDSVLFGCPLRPRSTPSAKSSFGWNVAPLLPTSSASSDWWTGGAGFGSSVRHFAVAQMSLSSSRIMLGDSLNWHLIPPAAPYVAIPGGADPRLHRGRANYLMYDFRVVSLDPTSAWTAVNNPAALP
jgi:prepilin-type N-terminal cleavage/methylation domain-containing protein